MDWNIRFFWYWEIYVVGCGDCGGGLKNCLFIYCYKCGVGW